MTDTPTGSAPDDQPPAEWTGQGTEADFFTPAKTAFSKDQSSSPQEAIPSAQTVKPAGLIERLEAAEVGSRELDVALCDALILPDMRKRVVGNGYFDCNSHVRVQMVAAKPSRSLDAALALAERLGFGDCFDIQIRPGTARVARFGETLGQWHQTGDCATPALALCAAILKSTGEPR